MSFKFNNSPLNAPVGCIVAYVGTTAPTGWLICDGSAFVSGTYPELYAFLGNVANTPNLNAYFLRGIGNAPGIYDVSYNGPTNARGTQLDAIKDHTHTINWSDAKRNGGSAVASFRSLPGASTGNTNLNPIADGTETRPVNYGIIWIIKA